MQPDGRQQRALFVSPRFVITPDRQARPTPGDSLASLGELVERVSKVMPPGGGVMVLDASAAHAVKLPVTRDELGELGEHDEHPAVTSCAEKGWGVGRIGDWTRVYRPGKGGQLIHVAVGPMLDRDSCPLIGANPYDTIAAFDLWHEVIGLPYHTSPGVAGMDLLEHLVPMGESRPTMVGRVGPSDGFEDDYRMCERGRCARGCIEHFRGPATGMRYAHAFDLNRAYIGAAVTVEVAARELKRTGAIPFDRSLAGWWYVELAPWADARMPDPAGYAVLPSGDRQTVRWLTTPRMTLLDQLTEAGVYGGVRIIDSMTAPARRPLRPWGERLRNAYDLCRAGGDKSKRGDQLDPRAYGLHVVELVRSAVKEAGRRAPGMLASRKHDDPRAYRPDWWYGMVALTGANLWRAMDKAGADVLGLGRKAGVQPMGRFPIAIDVDTIWYPSDERDPARAVPAALKYDPTGMRLGHFKPKAVRERHGRAA